MIRRDFIDAQGQACWLLFTQLQHADLAAQLAAAWDLRRLADPLRDELMWTVTHHDDGWRTWEHHPALDDLGRPRSFLEMAIGSTTAIWARSIDQARQHSSLAGLLVAQHFLHLLAGSTSSSHPKAQHFASRYRAVAATCRVGAADRLGDQADDQTIQQLQEYLQLFDLLSLTLCCGPPTDAVELRLPAGESLICRPISEFRWQLDPWLCNVPSLSLRLTGRRVPQRRYHDAQDLKQSAQPRQVIWTLHGEPEA